METTKQIYHFNLTEQIEMRAKFQNLIGAMELEKQAQDKIEVMHEIYEYIAQMQIELDHVSFNTSTLITQKNLILSKKVLDLELENKKLNLLLKNL